MDEHARECLHEGRALASTSNTRGTGRLTSVVQSVTASPCLGIEAGSWPGGSCRGEEAVVVCTLCLVIGGHQSNLRYHDMHI